MRVAQVSIAVVLLMVIRSHGEYFLLYLHGAAKLLRVDNTNRNKATVAWHWLFMAQPERFPETMISAVFAEWFLKSSGGNRTAPIVLDEYIRCFIKKTITGACRDYREFARSIPRWILPTRTAKWHALADIVGNARSAADPGISYGVAQVREQSRHAQPLPTGHYLQEEAPDSVIEHFLKIFQGVNGEEFEESVRYCRSRQARRRRDNKRRSGPHYK
jgi:haloacetate dehalogenase